jgi:hypothetical protein
MRILSKRNNAYENVRNCQEENYSNGNWNQQSFTLKRDIYILYANYMKSLSRLCIHFNYCERELNRKKEIKLIQL